MAQLLRQSTQVIVQIGPAVAVGDGFTPVTSLDLSTADEAELLKANTTTTTSISAATFAAITGCDGWYGLTLTTSHTDTVGTLTVMVNDDSLILPIFARFQVVEEAVFDAMFASSAALNPPITSDIHSLATKIYSDTTIIYSDTTIIYSDTTHIDSDVTLAESRLLVVKSDTSDIQSQLTKVYSDTTRIHSDTTAIPADVLAAGDIDGFTLEEALKLMGAALAGKLSGAATTTITIRSMDDTVDRIVATVDADGNRTAVTLDETG